MPINGALKLRLYSIKANEGENWSSLIEGSTKRRHYAVLHIPPVDSPEKAVRASIVADQRKRNSGGIGS
jgi:hypothetical protein